MKFRLAILLATTAWCAPAVHAQDKNADASAQAPAEAPDDIIVTAQRYEQRLQDVPISVSVVGAKELAARGVTDLKDLQYSVPGFSTFEYGVGRQFLQMRGISNTIGSSTIGIYLDETPLGLDGQGEVINIRLLDLERVEVLRGPQATLYGQGSMGGTIRYIPAAPRLDAVGGSFDGEYSATKGGGSNYRAVGVLNLPLATDKAGLRLVAGYERIGGYIDNLTTGQKDVNSADIYTVRGTLLVKPTEQLTLSLLGLYQESEQKNQDFGVNYRSTAGVPTPITDRYTLVQAKASYDLGFAELSTSAGYIDRRNTIQFDLSPFYVPALTAPPPFGFGLPVGFITRVAYPGTYDYEIFNAEVRLGSTGQGPLGWQLGATYRDLKSDVTSSAIPAPGTLPFAILDFDQASRNKSYALYGELAYAFTPELKATAGLRYFSERKRQVTDSSSFGVATLDSNRDTFHSFNPRFNLSYELTPDSMVFVNVAKGFRSGGFNITSAGGGVFAIPPSYDSDEIWTYELGTKHQMLGNRLTLEASLYRSEWSKVQSYIFVPGSAIQVVANSGEVAGWGLDLSASARPVDALTLTATYGWNNLEFTNATADKAKGDPVDGAVRESWSASVDFRPRLANEITGIFRVDYQHAGKAQITVRNFPSSPVIQRPGRDLVNLRLGAAFGQAEVALFVDNLFDQNAPNLIGPFGVIAEDVEQRPRVIGVNGKINF